jgi:hypothetical protein
MPDTIAKAALLDQIQAGYRRLEDLLASLSEAQMTITGVNGPWSVKDNLAHLTVWQDYLLSQLQGVQVGTRPAEFMSGLNTEDEINERVYQENKDRPLAEVRGGFRASYRRVLAAVEATNAETLNSPIPWSTSSNPLWPFIAGNTYEHYEEHGGNIRRWLAASQLPGDN